MSRTVNVGLFNGALLQDLSGLLEESAQARVPYEPVWRACRGLVVLPRVS